MAIRRIRVDHINPAPYNPRDDLQPGDHEYEKLKRSIEELGYIDPIIWNERTGNMVGGHQLFQIQMEEDPTEIEVSVVNLDVVREKALNVALNKISGEWDDEALAALFNELSSTGLDSLNCFDLNEISDLLKLFDAGDEETAGDFENNEVNLGSFDEDKFAHTCPRCGFAYNDKNGSGESDES